MARQARPCSATKGNGQPCGNFSINGGSVCAIHGGRAPRVREAAERRVLVAQAQRAVNRYGIAVQTTPEDALLHELYRSRGEVDYLTARVQQLGEDAMINGVSRAVRTRRGDTEVTVTTAEARKHVLLQLLEDARRHHAEVAATCARLGIEARLAAVAEAEMRTLQEHVSRRVVLALMTLGLGPDDTSPAAWRATCQAIADAMAAPEGELPRPPRSGRWQDAARPVLSLSAGSGGCAVSTIGPDACGRWPQCCYDAQGRFHSRSWDKVPGCDYPACQSPDLGETPEVDGPEQGAGSR